MGERDEVVERLVAWAEGEEAVRAVLLTGSRASPDRTIDRFSDYDVALLLEDPSELEREGGWIEEFGPVLVSLSESYEALGGEVASRLVQYRDGTKIDFSLVPTEGWEHEAAKGRLPSGFDAGYRVLVDEDGLCDGLPQPSDRPVGPEHPDRERYRDVANEFWWETLYVAKWLARGDQLPARYSAECVMRYRCLVPMLEWDVRVAADGDVSVGPYGRGIHEYLNSPARKLLERSYGMATTDEGWSSLFAAADLFETAARRVGTRLGHPYPEDTARSVRSRLRSIRERCAGDPGTPDANPVLETGRLLLRPLEMSDASRVRELAGNRKVARNTASIPYPYPEGAAEEWIAEQGGDDTRIVFAIVESGSEELVGGIGLHLEPEHERGELGYWIGEDRWGRGYATEAAEAVVRFAFEKLGLERVHARTFARNPASRRVLEKIGMRREGLLPRHFKKWNEFVDVECYGIVLEDWLEDEARGRTDDADERKDD